MSARKKKGKAGVKHGEAELPSVHPVAKKPSGHPPTPMVMSRHHAGMISRGGKGFSEGELGAVALPANVAARWGVSLDQRRRSVLEPNVQALRKWFSPPAPKPAPSPSVAEKKPRRRAAKKKEA